MKNLDLTKLKNKVATSAFSKSFREITTPLDFLKGHLLRYGLSIAERQKIDDEKLMNTTTKEFFRKMIPEFQRDNDKWNQEMQIKFVENVLLGVGTSFLLGTVSKDKTNTNCKIIDGQQRITALLQWLNGDFPIFDDIFYSKTLNSFLIGCFNVTTKIYQFNTEAEMVQFYIDMNENITHSAEDIKRAKDYLKEIKE